MCKASGRLQSGIASGKAPLKLFGNKEWGSAALSPPANPSHALRSIRGAKGQAFETKNSQ